MPFWICHDDDHALVVVVPFTGRPAAELNDGRHSLLDVVDGDVEVDPYLAGCRLGHRLERQSRLGITPFAEVDPTVLRRSGFATEEGAPESGHAFGIDAVDRHTGPHVRHALDSDR